MKRSRFRGQSDSLDLLLDTICNAFGGIIFIACLVTLLVRNSDTGPNAALEEANTAMMERRVDIARTDLEQLEALIASLTEQRAPLETLKKKRDQLTNSISELRARAGEIGKETAPTPTGELERLRTTNRPLRDEFNSRRDAATEHERQIASLEARAQSLSKETSVLKEKSRQKVRLPLERQPTKSPFWVILKHGSVYPLRDDSGDTNKTSLTWIPQANGSDEVTPLNGSGAQLPRDAASLSAQLRAVADGSHYLAVCLFPDSHEAWRDYSRLIQEAGLEYGLNFELAQARLSFGPGGSVPPPL